MTKALIRQTSKKTAAIRIGFGLVWLIDAIFKWQPAFIHGFYADVMASADGQPGWLHWWFNSWLHLFVHNPTFFAVLTASIESLLAVALIIGYPKRFTFVSGSIFAFLVWALGEGFGGPYASGATDIGGAIMYIFVFAALDQLELVAPSRWSFRSRYSPVQTVILSKG